MLLNAWATALLAATANAVSFMVSSNNGNATSPYQYGLMFEDINNSGDGGVYAELIQNRAFQGDTIFPKNLDFWNPFGGAQLSLQNLSNPLSSALSTSMQVTTGNVSYSDGHTIGFSNLGFWGFPIVSSWEYKGSFWVSGNLHGKVSVCLTSLDDHEWASADVQVASTDKGWTQYNYTLHPSVSAPNSNNTLNFTFPATAAKGPVNFNLLSLFPPTYNDRPNGLRVDLMEAMADLKPTFFRMPGGNNVEGNRAPYWWNWTETIGPLEQRPGYPGTWGYENTNGLGLLEYLIWAQDLKMEPILGIWSGLWLDGEVLTESELQPYIQSALDEIEFCMGDASTTWGARREALGHGPFPINFIEVGNEDSLSGGGPSYRSYRFQAFHNAIKAAYPNMTIIASFYDVDGATPPFDSSGDFHEYAIPRQMSTQFGYFDNYTSEHPLLIGEYAVIEYDTPGKTGPEWYSGAPRALYPFWYGSVAEAIFLLGAERNSDKIIGSAYAPSFMNYNRWEWIPDLIQYDANPANTVLSTSYRVLQLLAATRITENLPITFSSGGYNPVYLVAGRSDVTGSHVLKAAIYNASTPTVEMKFSFEGVGAGAQGTLTYLTAPMNASSTIGHDVVEKKTASVKADGKGEFSVDLPNYSVAVFEAGTQSPGGSHGGSGGGRKGWKGWGQWRHGKGVYGGNRNQWGQCQVE